MILYWIASESKTFKYWLELANWARVVHFIVLWKQYHTRISISRYLRNLNQEHYSMQMILLWFKRKPRLSSIKMWIQLNTRTKKSKLAPKTYKLPHGESWMYVPWFLFQHYCGCFDSQQIYLTCRKKAIDQTVCKCWM